MSNPFLFFSTLWTAPTSSKLFLLVEADTLWSGRHFLQLQSAINDAGRHQLNIGGRKIYSQEMKYLVKFTQGYRTNAAMAVRQFPADGRSHRTNHLRLKDEPLCKSHRKPALQLLSLFLRCFPGVSPSI